MIMITMIEIIIKNSDNNRNNNDNDKHPYVASCRRWTDRHRCVLSPMPSLPPYHNTT